MNRTTLCGTLLTAALAWSQGAAETVSGRVTDDTGVAIAGAIIEAGGERTSSGPDGRFELRVNVDAPVALRIRADGYYSTRHSFAAEDLELLQGDVGPIGIVAQKPGRRLLLFAGDAMLARRYVEPPAGEATLVRKGRVLEDGKKILGTIKPYIELADYASVNMETQLSSAALDERLPKSITFWSSAEFAALLEWAGFDYVALGNNHTWDYQGQGLSATYKALGETSLGYSGAGFDEPSARAPWTQTLDGVPYAFLSYVGWAGTFSPSQAAAGGKGGAALGGSAVFAEDLAAIPGSTTTVLQYHSGLEYSGAPAVSERTRLREAVDAGADLAIGHHAHVLQGLELYKDRLIAYSMGNFLFDQTYYTTQLGMLLYAWVDGDALYRAEVVPMYVNGYVPTPATGTMRYAILHRLARLSAPLGTCLRANGAHAAAVACDGPVSRRIDLGTARPGPAPVPLATLGLHPSEAAAFALDGHRYRLGTDILRRGDFEAEGRHGAPERGWIRGERTGMADGDSRHLRVVAREGAPTRAGMSAFQRVFTRSNPTTLSGRIHTDGPAAVVIRLQRRRPGMSAAEALASGPLLTVGRIRVKQPGWHNFSIDFDQPRVATESLRLLFDVAADPGHPGDVEVLFDDLAWVEWRSPWLDGNNQHTAAEFGTHVQFRPLP